MKYLVNGREASNSMKSPTMVRIDESLKDRARDYAERDGRSLSNLICLALQVYVQERSEGKRTHANQIPAGTNIQ